MCDHRQDADETQAAFVRRVLVTDGRVSAHDMTYTHGITRTAAIIHTLRHGEGLDIDTDGKKGHQATYHLVSPLREEAAAALPRWKCLTCGSTVQASGSALLAGYAELPCGPCQSKRLHKRADG